MPAQRTPCVAPSSRATPSFASDSVHGDDLGRARRDRAEERGEADPAAADDRDPVARPDAAVCHTAPTPVVTAQPTSPATSKGTSFGNHDAERSGTTHASANDEMSE